MVKSINKAITIKLNTQVKKQKEKSKQTYLFPYIHYIRPRN